MKLSEIFDHLSSGELSQVFLGTSQDDELLEENYSKLVSHINLGLIDLYSRFALKIERISLVTDPTAMLYKLAVPNLLKIEKVMALDGQELPVNNGVVRYSCTTPAMDTLRFPKSVVEQSPDLPYWLKTTQFEVTYRALPVKIAPVNGIIDPPSIEVDIPYSHLTALLYFVASRVNNPLGMVNEFHSGNSWAAKYNNECARLLAQGLEIDPMQDNDKLSSRGFV